MPSPRSFHIDTIRVSQQPPKPVPGKLLRWLLQSKTKAWSQDGHLELYFRIVTNSNIAGQKSAKAIGKWTIQSDGGLRKELPKPKVRRWSVQNLEKIDEIEWNHDQKREVISHLSQKERNSSYYSALIFIFKAIYFLFIKIWLSIHFPQLVLST